MMTLVQWRSVFRLFGYRNWLLAFVGTVVTMVIIGLVTAIFDNPFFVRMTPVRTQDYIIWVATGLLAGFIAGTYILPAKAPTTGKIVSGGLLSFLAVGCPICSECLPFRLTFRLDFPVTRQFYH